MKRVILATVVTCSLMFASTGEELTKQHGCMACHDTVGAKLAPSFAGVGNKHKEIFEDGALASVIRGIKEGSQGRFGQFRQYTMPAYPNIDEKDLNIMANYIVSLAPQALCVVDPGAARGDRGQGQGQGQGTSWTR